MDLNKFLDYGFYAAIAGLVAVMYVPRLWAWWKNRKPAPAKTAADNRPDLSAAICLIEDHVLACKCAKSRADGQAAVDILAQLVVRPVTYQPSDLPANGT